MSAPDVPARQPIPGTVTVLTAGFTAFTGTTQVAQRKG
jgi:hypothetical protein